MKIITADSFGSVHMLIFYVVMNSLYCVNQVKASVTSGSAGASSNGELTLFEAVQMRCWLDVVFVCIDSLIKFMTTLTAVDCMSLSVCVAE